MTLEKLIVLTGICFALTLAGCAAEADSFPKIPHGFETKWDVTKKDNTLSPTFYASIDHSYDLGISFKIIDPSVRVPQLQKITGDGGMLYWPTDPNNHTPAQVTNLDEERKALRGVTSGIYVAKHAHPGIIIPIHIQIEMVDDDSDKTTTIFDKVVDTEGAIGSGANDVERNIQSIHLVPGKYIVHLTPTQDTVLPTWVETYFYVGGRFFK